VLLLRKGIPNGLAVLLTVILLILVLVFLGWVFSLTILQIVLIGQQYGSKVADQYTQLAAAIRKLPPYSSGKSGLLKSIDPSAIFGFLQVFVGAMADFFPGILILFLLFVFMLVTSPSLIKTMREKFGVSHQLTMKTKPMLESSVDILFLDLWSTL
jgi:predicted PurR-regulated permease PerM